MVFISGGSSLVFTAITNTEQLPLHVDISCATKMLAVSSALISVHVVGGCGIAHVVVKCAVRLAGPSAGDMAPPARKGVWHQSGSSWRKMPLCSGPETKTETRSLASAGHTPRYCTGQWAPPSMPDAHQNLLWNSCLSCNCIISPPDQWGAIEGSLPTRGLSNERYEWTDLNMTESKFI